MLLHTQILRLKLFWQPRQAHVQADRPQIRATGQSVIHAHLPYPVRCMDRKVCPVAWRYVKGQESAHQLITLACMCAAQRSSLLTGTLLQAIAFRCKRFRCPGLLLSPHCSAPRCGAGSLW